MWPQALLPGPQLPPPQGPSLSAPSRAPHPTEPQICGSQEPAPEAGLGAGERGLRRLTLGA